MSNTSHQICFGCFNIYVNSGKALGILAKLKEFENEHNNGPRPTLSSQTLKTEHPNPNTLPPSHLRFLEHQVHKFP
ncbi:hypothetical protein Scep_029923 [Stephania cephalantha]|uniref:Uncharacterized protein n=1 Tax=Stephania cephalantha TaxID=152367 RepID=A0AAP0E278_9MAGN